jgi:hypothetical protein
MRRVARADASTSAGNHRGRGAVVRPMIRTLATLLLALALASCTVLGTRSPEAPGATPSATTTGAPMTAAALRLQLIDRLGPLWYCDRDEFPVAHGNEADLAIERFPEIKADAEMYDALTARLGIDAAAAPTDAQKLAIYRLWKVATAISLDPMGGGRYRFDYLAQPVDGAPEGVRTAGAIDDAGVMTIEQQASAPEPICPICLARGTWIETPNGPNAVDRLRLGALVWTLDREGRRVTGTVIAVGSTRAPIGHRVVRITLADGRTVTASPGHPLADGRPVAALKLGDTLDGSAVARLEILAYDGGSTFDLVVSGQTGIYLAGGIPLRSTLDPAALERF